MKRLFLITLTVAISVLVNAQNITGKWNGVLKVQGVQLRLVFNITKTTNGYSATMDSPDQGAKDIPVTTTEFKDAKLKIAIPNLALQYNATLKNNMLDGTFTQGMLSVPLKMSRKKVAKTAIERYQNPKKPYPYKSEEVIFSNKKHNISLAGTLTLPRNKKHFPTVILISGSGAQNRDEELLGHKPFLVLSDYLTRQGIAVLRFDDRGTAKSEGDFKSATSADFATDVEAAFLYLQSRKDIDKNNIGLIGHSEGGIIAPMVANNNKDIAFVILLAAPGINGLKNSLLQSRYIGKASGLSNAVLDKNEAINAKTLKLITDNNNQQKLKTDLTNLLRDMLKKYPNITAGKSQNEYIEAQLQQLTTPWLQYYLKYNPAFALEQLKCPILALNGAKDTQVPAKENIEAIKNALQKSGNKQVNIKIFPKLNHLFQECNTGLPAEYGTIKQTFSPTALQTISIWILNKSTKKEDSCCLTIPHFLSWLFKTV